jgi:hypothetical protein
LTEKDKYKAYREKVQRYAKEEKKLWEDLRYELVNCSANSLVFFIFPFIM